MQWVGIQRDTVPGVVKNVKLWMREIPHSVHGLDSRS
jgi:hypothetical protein